MLRMMMTVLTHLLSYTFPCVQKLRTLLRKLDTKVKPLTFEVTGWENCVTWSLEYNR
jgi:hypothetical protein